MGSFIFSDRIIQWLLLPSRPLHTNMTIQVLKVQGLLMLKIWVACAAGVVLSVPVLGYQLWAFIAPGLYRHEKRLAPMIAGAVTLFFCIGALFAYFILIPFALAFLTGIGAAEIQRNISIDYYIRFVIQLVIAAGLVFQMPVLSFLLTRVGILTPAFMRRYWRHAIIVILIISAFITPPDPLSMILMAMPLLLLYEISYWISRLVYRRNRLGEEEPHAESGTANDT